MSNLLWVYAVEMSEWLPLPLPERTERLDQAVGALVFGGEVVSQGSTMVTIRYARPVNHVLHVVLSIFTCGLWLFVWAFVGLMSKPTRYVRVWVDEYGRVSTDDGKDGGWVERLPAVRSTAS